VKIEKDQQVEKTKKRVSVYQANCRQIQVKARCANTGGDQIIYQKEGREACRKTPTAKKKKKRREEDEKNRMNAEDDWVRKKTESYGGVVFNERKTHRKKKKTSGGTEKEELQASSMEGGGEILSRTETILGVGEDAYEQGGGGGVVAAEAEGTTDANSQTNDRSPCS